MSNTIEVTTEGDTIITVTPEGNVTVGVEYNPVAGSGTDTNIGVTRTNAAVTVTSSSGTDGTILAADASNAGVFTAANYTKLAAITGINTGDQNLSPLMVKANNLSDVTSVSTARTNLGLGSLATQSGTFSGTSSGINTGDQDLSPLAVKANNLSDLTSASSARTNLGLGTLATQSGTFSGTSSGTNTGDQTNITGNAATVTTNANLTGPVTSIGNATAIAAGAITNTMLANGSVANLSGTNTGDQSIFKNVAVAGQSTVVADTTNDTLTLVAGTNITLTTDALTDSVTITASGGGGSGDVVGPASATNGAFALFDTTTGKLLKNGSVPGGAATLNVGTSAGTVAAGDDSRLTNDRTPTAHASTHVTGGTDAIQSATSVQNGLATSTQITKLDGIEAGADVTDATNVSAAGAVMKTLADAKGDLFAATAADTVTRLPIGATNGHVLTIDSTETTGMKWAVTSGGDVVGPASSTDNAFARFDSTTGKLLQNSAATLDDVGLASVDGVQFSTTPTSTVGQAKTVWDTTNSCLSVGLNASVNSLIGTDSHVQVYNPSASTMTVMQVVRQSGSSGTRLSVALGLADTDANSATAIGVVAQSIASHSQGFIQTAGLLQGVNTNAFNEGDTLWLSATTAGLITNVKPTAPNHGVRIGYCIKKAGGAGIILIDILNGFELDELHDVKITTPIADNSFLTYDTASAVWLNEAPSAAKTSIGLGSVTNDAQTKAAIVPNTAPTAGQLLVGNVGGTAYAPVSLNNDATVASTGALTLATVNSNVGAFGSTTQSAAVTVNAKGLVTAISASTITPAIGSITGLGTGVATALAVNVGSAGAPVVNGGALGTPSSGVLTNCTGLPATGLANNAVTLAKMATGTAGNLISYDATGAPVAVVTGTAGQVLTSNGAGLAPTMQTVSSGTKTIARFTPRDNQPPATAFATLDTRNSIATLDFDTATEEGAIFVGVVPEAAVLTSGLLVRITWTATTATSGDCRWGAQWMRLNTDIDFDSFDTATEVTTTTNAISGVPALTAITCTAIDGLTVGDAFRLRIYRDTTDPLDTMAGDAELLTVEVRTAN